uniref:DUF630 domain-containing protein n=1 Tax=Oryza sativa subsp. japonica TaxID=39947 RepID=Q6ZB72_ORYSJ|nr:hypothetical protein [Oryza sativa Japonica Group]BAD03267.1 hypothetical protein [Oryza sativa Japonica Group]
MQVFATPPGRQRHDAAASGLVWRNPQEHALTGAPSVLCEWPMLVCLFARCLSGCAQSRIENEEAVAKCKERRQWMKSVVQARNAFAAVHSAYAMSLRDTGAALFEFAHGEGVLPPPPPPPTTTGPRGRRRAPWDHTSTAEISRQSTIHSVFISGVTINLTMFSDVNTTTRSCSNGGDLIRGSRSLSVSEGSSDGCLLHGDVPQQALVLLAAARPQRVSIPASSLLSRLYYNNGGQSKWILSWSAVAG